MRIELESIGTVHCDRAEAIDDRWDVVQSRIELDSARFTPEALMGLDAFSHLEVVYSFHKTDPAKANPRPGIPVATPPGPRSASSRSGARTGPTTSASPLARSCP
jgi:tRNA (Thr-GGU) A37 N-methylase